MMTQVMYVWFDALTNYVSTLGNPFNNDEQFITVLEKWKSNAILWKDNNRFQSAMWQAMLIAADLPNSHQILVNGFITADGGVRMSKTLGNGVDPHDITSEYGTDAFACF
jgi:methionyl-tRNA synthetase